MSPAIERKDMEKISIHEKVTNQIVSDMEQGKLVWEKPWTGGALKLPSNPSTGKTYQGINTLVLWSQGQLKGYKSSQWLTFKQALELNCCVRKGEKATSVVFYKTLTVEDHDTSEEKQIPMLRQYSVFNLEQLDGSEEMIAAELSAPTKKTFIESCSLADQAMSIAKVQYKEIDSAFYHPSSDTITLPLKESFKSQVDFYGTALHELTHWTGHTDRLDRLKKYSESRHFRAFEELVAELGAAFLCAEFNLEYTTQHAAYIQAWLKALKDDKTMIFKAAAQAQKAINMIKEKSGLKIETKESNEEKEGAA